MNLSLIKALFATRYHFHPEIYNKTEADLLLEMKADADHNHQNQGNYLIGCLELLEEYPSGTLSGTFSGGSWVRRNLNSITARGLSASLDNKIFSVPAGTYLVEVAAQAYFCGSHQCQLYDEENELELIFSIPGWSYPSGGGVSEPAVIRKIWTFADNSTYSIRHRCSTTSPTHGFGVATGWGGPEIYCSAHFTPIA